MKDTSIRVLIVEDSEDDALLIIRNLKKGGFNPVYERVETAAAMKKALKEKQWNVILCDYSLPKFNAPSAIAVLKEANIDIPIIIVSGTIGEETAIECMRLGAQDYIMKGNLSRLCPAIDRELKEAEVRNKQKRAEKYLRESEEKYRLIFEYSPLGLLSFDEKGVIVACNDNFVKIIGSSREKLIGLNMLNLPDKNIVSVIQKTLKGSPGFYEGNYSSVTAKKITPVRCIFEPMEVGDGLIPGGVGIVEDITERKQAEQILRESEDRFRRISSITSDIAYSCSTKEDGRYSIDWMIGATEKISGYSIEEIKAQRCWRFLVVEEDLALFEKNVIDLAPGLQGLGELRIRHKNGGIVWIASYTECFMTTETPEHFILYGALVDITEHKQAEEALRESEQRYRAMMEQAADAVFMHDETGRILDVNQKACQSLGYSRKELLSKSIRDIDSEAIQTGKHELWGKVLAGEHFTFESCQVRKDGSFIPVEVTLSSVRLPLGPSVLGIVRDITERKMAEEALKNSEAKYRDIFENAIEGIYQSTIDGRFMTANASLARMAGYDSPEELIESIKDIRNQLYVNPEDRERFMEIRNAKGFVEGFEVEFYKKDRSTFWVVINARAVKDEKGEILYFEGLIENITLRKHSEKQLYQTLENLRKSFEATIHAMVSATEMRDPYTAGHQLRSAKLACAIATEMGLPPDKIDGIRMAGSIHDIGKLSVPAEILSKPTRLTNIEFSLIKEHSQRGYEILKDVESPWPLAQIVYQHHERMNGSGYPRNLKGDEILLEARIMAVADVVEAMASHRPYRPGFGIEAALEEITKNKGILYDDAVADACLRSFREKGYQLE